MTDVFSELASLGSATVYEAGGRRGYVEADLIQVVPGSRAAGPARDALVRRKLRAMLDVFHQ